MDYVDKQTNKLRVVELFAGVGGFRIGIEKALGKERVEVIYANEWDKYASSIYRRHFGDIDTRDITTVPVSDIADHDLLVGGVPCQSWSIAGKRGGFDDIRGNMWFEFFRILRDKQPAYFLAENVRGLLSHDQGNSFENICEHLCECGYAIDFEVLNSRYFGVPQNRERVFIIGKRLDLLDSCQVF